MTASTPRAALDGRADGIVPLLRRLMRHPTLGPGDATEQALAELAGYLEDAGLDVRVVRDEPDVPTLLATVAGDEPGPHVLLQGHIDVVPVDDGWTRDPFAADEVDGHVHGRGAVDMKSGLSAFAAVLGALRGRLRRGAVTLLVDVDEETGSERGLNPYIARHGLAEYDWAICGEPTGLRPYLGNRGLIWAKVRIHGRASHAGMPSAGRNPLPPMARLLAGLPEPAYAAGPYGGAGPSLTPTTLHAGHAVNALPDVAELGLDRRIVPGEDVDAAVAELRGLAERPGDGFTADCDIVKVWPSCLLAEDSALARTARRICAAHGADPAFGFDDACNDASFLAAAGVPTLIWGPGAPELAHTSDEYVAAEDVRRAARMYLDAALALTQNAGNAGNGGAR